MDLTVVGAGPAYTDDPTSVGACYLLRHDGAAIVLDLGQGAFARLASRIEPSTLEAIVISHLHPDHFVDLVALRHYLRFYRRPPARLRVLGPTGVGARIDALHAEPGFSAAALDCEALAPGVVEVRPFLIEAGRVRHHGDSFGFRVSVPGHESGLVYSGDIGLAGDLRPLIRPGDILLVEVSFGPGPVPEGAMHLNASAVAELAAESRPSRVLLTHLQMGHDRQATVEAVQAGCEGKVEIVGPGFETAL
ncbi:MAG: MBL fold metallo-hydrolase [Chloroflexi bacterium]|nr:MBL fold metallo-hydrolase [Chloroflexota bacterium]